MSKLSIGGLQGINEEMYNNSVKIQCELKNIKDIDHIHND